MGRSRGGEHGLDKGAQPGQKSHDGREHGIFPGIERSPVWLEHGELRGRTMQDEVGKTHRDEAMQSLKGQGNNSGLSPKYDSFPVILKGLKKRLT